MRAVEENFQGPVMDRHKHSVLRRGEEESQACREEPSSTDCADDLRLLLDCLHYHHGSSRCANGSPQRQALTTIAAMCCNESVARDQVRTSGALQFVLEMVYSEPSHTTMQTALMALGCAAEKNVVNQMKLCGSRLFKLLTAILSSPESRLTLLHSVAYLLGCLMAGNGKGQNLARENATLTALVALFKSLLSSVAPTPGEGCEGVTCAGSDSVTCANGDGVEVWKSVVSALCTATNNPQNEQNQQVCSAVFPAALSLLSSSLHYSHHKTLQSALGIITSCVASNATVQSRLCMVGGLHSFVAALKKAVEMKNDPESGEMQCEGGLGVHLVQCMCAAAFGHASNRALLCSLGSVPLLVSLFRTPSLPLSSITSLTLCLGMLTEDNTTAQRHVVECGGLPLLVSNMAEYKDEELSKAATFVLQCCFQSKTDKQPGEGDADMSTAVASLDHWLEPAGHSLQQHNTTQQTNVSHSSQMPDTCTGLSQTALRTLDSNKLPVSTQVTSWLHAAHGSSAVNDDPAAPDVEVEWLPRLQVLRKVLEGMDLSSMEIMASHAMGEGRAAQTTALAEKERESVKLVRVQKKSGFPSASETPGMHQCDEMRELVVRKRKCVPLIDEEKEQESRRDTSYTASRHDSGKNGGVYRTQSARVDGNVKSTTVQPGKSQESVNVRSSRKEGSPSPVTEVHRTRREDRCICQPGKAENYEKTGAPDLRLVQADSTQRQATKQCHGSGRRKDGRGVPGEDVRTGATSEATDAATGRHAHTVNDRITRLEQEESKFEKKRRGNAKDAKKTTSRDQSCAAELGVKKTKGCESADKLNKSRDEGVSGKAEHSGRAEASKGATTSTFRQSLPTDPHTDHVTVSGPLHHVVLTDSTPARHGIFKTPSTAGRSNMRYAHASVVAPSIAQADCRSLRGHQPSTKKSTSNNHPLESRKKSSQNVKQQPESSKSKQAPCTNASWSHQGIQGAMKENAVCSGSQYHGSRSSKISNHFQNAPHASHSTQPTSRPHFGMLSTSCVHHCLACRPRLKCPLLTSRNFLKVLRVDKFTCAYHRRLGGRVGRGSTARGHVRPALLGGNPGQQKSREGTKHICLEDDGAEYGKGESCVLHAEKYDTGSSVEYHHQSVHDDQARGPSNDHLSSSLCSDSSPEQIPTLSASPVSDTSDKTYRLSSGQNSENMEMYRYTPPHRVTNPQPHSPLVDHCNSSCNESPSSSVSSLDGRMHKGLQEETEKSGDDSSVSSVNVAVLKPRCGRRREKFHPAMLSSDVSSHTSLQAPERLSYQHHLQPPLSGRPHGMLAAVVRHQVSSSARSSCGESNAHVRAELQRGDRAEKGQHATIMAVKGKGGKEARIPRKGDLKVDRGKDLKRKYRSQRENNSRVSKCSPARMYQLTHGPSRKLQPQMKTTTQRVPLRDRGNSLSTAVRSEYDCIRTPLNSARRAREVQQLEQQAGQRRPEQQAGQRRPAPAGNVGKKEHNTKSVPFSHAEVTQLLQGVQEMGHRWKHILTAFNFHPSRTAVNLKDKYRNLTHRR